LYLLLAVEGYNNLADVADLVLDPIRNIKLFIIIFCLGSTGTPRHANGEDAGLERY
jgi:hypothetical protein